MEDFFDNRADIYCLVTSDSDFAYLCRKLRERGAAVYIVGEEKTPDALRNASDQFFEYHPPESEHAKTPAAKVQKRRPKALINAIALLADDTEDGWIGLGALGQYMRRTDPGFSPNKFGHSSLSTMVRTYPDLKRKSQKDDGYWVRKPKNEPEE